jgi:hypothetical protein
MATEEQKVSYPVYSKPEQLDHLDEGIFNPVRCLLRFFASFDVSAASHRRQI